MTDKDRYFQMLMFLAMFVYFVGTTLMLNNVVKKIKCNINYERPSHSGVTEDKGFPAIYETGDTRIHAQVFGEYGATSSTPASFDLAPYSSKPIYKRTK